MIGYQVDYTTQPAGWRQSHLLDRPISQHSLTVCFCCSERGTGQERACPCQANAKTCWEMGGGQFSLAALQTGPHFELPVFISLRCPRLPNTRKALTHGFQFWQHATRPVTRQEATFPIQGLSTR